MQAYAWWLCSQGKKDVCVLDSGSLNAAERVPEVHTVSTPRIKGDVVRRVVSGKDRIDVELMESTVTRVMEDSVGSGTDVSESYSFEKALDPSSDEHDRRVAEDPDQGSRYVSLGPSSRQRVGFGRL